MWYVHINPLGVSEEPSPHGPYETLAQAIEIYHKIKRQSEPLLTIKEVKERRA